MSTAVIQIGNSDDKLTQGEWSQFCGEVAGMVGRLSEEIHFAGASLGTQPWQNACWVFTPRPRVGSKIDRELTELAKVYRQDSIALTVGVTEFVTPGQANLERLG